MWSLTSWTSPDGPSAGEFTCSMNLTGSPELVIKKASQKIWQSGPWTGEGFNGLPGMVTNPVTNYNLVNDANEIYYVFGVYNASVLSNLVSYPDDICDNYGKCGAFGSCDPSNAQICSCAPGFEPISPKDWNIADGSKGCTRKRELLCSKGDWFLKLAKMRLPDTSNYRVDVSLGSKECLLQRNRLQKQLFSPSLETNEETNAKFELPNFDLNSMMVATENFSNANKLGTGGFGSVYKGKLLDGREIAVKRLSKNSRQGVIEFKNEIELIAKLQHMNLVQIIGLLEEFFIFIKTRDLESFTGTSKSLQHAWELWIDGRVLESVDLTMGNSFPEQEVVSFIQVGILCVQENAKDRPTMYNVIFMLGNERPIPSPKQPAFVLISNHNSANASASPSINEMSITIVEGR
ncbi:hypothetical protein Scep_028638 [Stephania cephalantha]|uniref:Protein kinase domain-containing protein n=1 Tax=Stephania cephalantha TaxID=152367 RepID=A0AAP0EAB7_9MAGN